VTDKVSNQKLVLLHCLAKRGNTIIAFSLKCCITALPELNQLLDFLFTSHTRVAVDMDIHGYIHGLKCAARGSLQIQDAKKSPSRHNRTTLSGHIFATRAYIDNRKKLVKQQYLLYMH